MGKPILDIIVTHHDEPWETGKKFFDMLALQRDVDMDAFRVILVTDSILPFYEYIGKAPYPYICIRTDIAGPAGARNTGLRNATADWVMFCDFDDTFTSVCSLKLILHVLRDRSFDVGWMETWKEEKREPDFVNILQENFDSTDGKVYRRDMLTQNQILFEENCLHWYPALFNDAICSAIPAHRIKKITMPFAAYMKTFRKDGYNSGKDAYPAVLNEILCAQMMNGEKAVKENKTTNAKAYAADAVLTGYFLLNMRPDVITEDVRRRFMDFLQEHRDLFGRIDTATLDVAMSAAAARMDRVVQHLYMSYKIELMPPINALDIALKWAEETGAAFRRPNMPAATKSASEREIARNTAKQERVAVYCGTRNCYESMVTSAKSLLYHTPVDQVYFFTEDDVFPDELPDCIKTVNVSGQTFFSPDGVNYKNAWTYMCLMRAAYAKLLPQHDKILSLDIDIAVNDDISELWDLDMTDAYIAGVHEPRREQKDYINFGLVMMNLAKLRDDHMDDRIISALNNQYYDCPEQGCFSDLCRGHILLLPTDYNYTPHGAITGDTETPKVIHYAGIKYWKHYADFRRFADLPWEEILHRPAQRVAAYIGTANQYKMMLASAKSLLANTRMDQVYFLIEEDTFPEPLPDIIRTVNVSDQKYFTPDGPNWNSPFSYMPMLRAAYPDMFPQYDIILSIDNDTIVEADISPLFEMNMTNYYYAAALEARPGRKVEQPYFNAGVMLMNLKKMREDGIDTRTVADLNETHYLNDSQDALCASCRDHILLIPSAYNACMFTAQTDTVYIRNFAGNQKPWFDLFAAKYDKPWDELIRKLEHQEANT